jgi:hypothetical protein
MKPRNFPERRRQRQIDAFMRGALDSKDPGSDSRRAQRSKKARASRRSGSLRERQ